MSEQDFKDCAARTFGDEVQSWNEVVLRPLVELGRWFRAQDETVRWIFGTVAGAAGASAIAWIARIVGLGAAEVVLPILAAFAVGVGIGTGLLVVAECADRL